MADEATIFGSEDAYCGVCDSCERKSETVIALFYCFECEDKLCEQCESCHKRNKVSRHHVTQTLDSLKDEIDTITAIDKLSKCATHQTEEIKYLCEDHDQLCCSGCAVVHHGKCANVITMDQKVKQWKASTVKMDDVAENVEEMIETIVKQNAQQKENIETSEKTINEEVEDWEQAMIETAKQMKTKLHEETKKNGLELLSEVEAREKMTFENKKKISECKEMKRFGNSKGSENQQYLVKRMEQKTLTTVRQNSESMLKDISMARHVRFIEKYTKADFVKLFQDNFNVILGKAATLKETFESADGSGSGRYLLWLNGKTLLGAANRTNMLIIWDVETGRTLDTYQCIATVWGMLRLPDRKVLVALSSNQLLTISVNNNKITLDKTLSVTKHYFGLAYNGNKYTILASSRSDGSIDILNTDGTLAGTLPIDEATRAIVRGTYNLAYSNTTDVCYISGSLSSQLVAVTLQGAVIFTYSYSDLPYPWQIILDADDNIYVSSWLGHSVHQLDKAGKYIQQIIPTSNNLKNASGLAFRHDGNMFAVITNVPGKQVQIYEFK